MTIRTLVSDEVRKKGDSFTSKKSKMFTITKLFIILFLVMNTPKQESVYIPETQPIINSKTSEENNEKMRKYLRDNRIEIDTKGKVYIAFITDKEIKENTNIFIWVDWKTIWRLDKSKRIKTENPKEFLYQISSINLIWNNNYKFKVKIEWDKLNINAVVGENNNKITEIKVF